MREVASAMLERQAAAKTRQRSALKTRTSAGGGSGGLGRALAMRALASYFLPFPLFRHAQEWKFRPVFIPLPLARVWPLSGGLHCAILGVLQQLESRD